MKNMVLSLTSKNPRIEKMIYIYIYRKALFPVIIIVKNKRADADLCKNEGNESVTKGPYQYTAKISSSHF